jgi:phosphate/sulfate permease
MLFIATHLGLPVSTTHDIVGCILGFTIAAKGFSSVAWSVIIKVVVSWVASPLIAGLVAAIIFSFIKYAIMRSEHPFNRAYYLFPVILLVGLG